MREGVGSDRKWGVGFKLVHHDLGVDAGHGSVGEEDIVDQAIEGGKIAGPDPQEVVGLAGHGPCADDFWAGRGETCEGAAVLGAMCAKLNLHKGLDCEPKFFGREVGGVAGDVAFGLEALFAAADLAGGEMQRIGQFGGGGLSVALEAGKQAFVGLI